MRQPISGLPPWIDQSRIVMGVTEKMWDALTTIMMNDKVARLAGTVVAQKTKIESLAGRVIRLETALEITLATLLPGPAYREQPIEFSCHYSPSR
ncbi:MAG: hypothetical protein WC256_10345 [Desulfurivibrionaceae bacterium]